MKALLFANSDWYLYNFRLPLARYLRGRGVDVVMVAPRGAYAGRIEADGFRFRAVPVTRRGARPGDELASLRALVRVYLGERPDLAHHFTLKSIVYGSLAARVARVPAIVNAVAGLGYVFTSRDQLARLLRLPLTTTLRLALTGRHVQVIVQNPDDQRLIVDAGLVPESRTALIRGSGVDTAKFQPVDRRQRDTVQVMLCSRLLREKGVADFLAAARAVRRDLPQARFVVAGQIDAGNPGSHTAAEEARWREEGIATFLGHVEDVAALYAASDVVVLPSVYGEGVPRSILEAAASGLPLVTYDSAGCREAVRDGWNGRLVAPRDVAALSAAILDIARDAPLRERMGANSRSMAVAEFAEESVFSETWKVYERALGRSLEGFVTTK